VFRSRRDGLLEMGSLAARNGRQFRGRWFDTAGGEVITSTEAEGLVAVALTYRDSVKATRVLPFEKRDLLIVLAATLLPVVPSMLIRIPHEEWFTMASLVLGTSGLP
jgi:hypothetical protein